ncbi:hypothetical protein M0804_010057 [Polistes exclamans]|nr:hypothetical protein M0804_010057 [Polistes exclamans]
MIDEGKTRLGEIQHQQQKNKKSSDHGMGSWGVVRGGKGIGKGKKIVGKGKRSFGWLVGWLTGLVWFGWLTGWLTGLVWFGFHRVSSW